MAQYPAHIPDHRFRCHGTKSNNLRYRITAVQLSNMVDNLVTPVHTEVNVEVGHGDPLRVKEPFE